MMDTKKTQSWKARIKRVQANPFGGVMGEMMVQMDIDAMCLAERIELQAALATGRIPVTYKYLDDKLHAELLKGMI